MQKKNVSKRRTNHKDEPLPHYDFDYLKAKPNRFAGRVKAEDLLVVAVEPDVAEVFPTGAAVNSGLRALIRAMRTSAKSAAK